MLTLENPTSLLEENSHRHIENKNTLTYTSHQQIAIKNTVTELLRRARVEYVAPTLAELGVSEPLDLLDLDDEDKKMLNMKKIHAKRFEKELEKLRQQRPPKNTDEDSTREQRIDVKALINLIEKPDQDEELLSPPSPEVTWAVSESVPASTTSPCLPQVSPQPPPYDHIGEARELFSRCYSQVGYFLAGKHISCLGS